MIWIARFILSNNFVRLIIFNTARKALIIHLHKYKLKYNRKMQQTYQILWFQNTHSPTVAKENIIWNKHFTVTNSFISHTEIYNMAQKFSMTDEAVRDRNILALCCFSHTFMYFEISKFEVYCFHYINV